MQSNLFGFYSLNQSDMCNIYLFVVWGCVAGRLASEVPIYECSDGSSRRDDMVLEVDETSPKDTSVAMFSHTTGRLQWAVSINGTYDSKLGTFFTTENSENDTVVLKLVKKLDLELLRAQEMMITPDTIELIEMKIRCQDTDGATQFLEYDLRIQPKNEFHPVFNKAPYKTEIAENTVVGTELFNLKDKTMDMDFGNTELIFDIEPYTISEFDGKQYVIMDDPQSGKILLSQQLDYEAFKQRRRTYFLINVTVADDGGFKSVTSINVTVLDKNDLGIEFEYPGCQTPCLYANYTAETNEAYTGILDVKPRPLQARDLDTLNTRIQYTLTSEYDSQFFQVDEITGDVYQTSPLTNDSYGYAVNLQVHASEVDDDSHFLLTNITVFIEERKQPSRPEAGSTAVPVPERSDIECGPNSISVFVPAALVSDSSNMTWRDDNCLVTSNGTHYIGTISLTNCGTTIRIDDNTVSFSNDLISHSRLDASPDATTLISVDALSNDSLITYGEDYSTVIPIECVYPRRSNITTSYEPIKQNVRFFEKRYGQLDLYMKQYETETFDKEISDMEYPRKVPLNNDIYIGMGLNSLADDLAVKVERCIATSTSSPADKNWRELVHSGCPVNSVHLTSKSEDKEVRFSFKAFDFRHNSTGFIYVHCEATVCDRSNVECNMGCPERSKRAATGPRTDNAHLVSTGPLLVDKDFNTDKEQFMTIPNVVAALSLLVALVAVTIAVIGWTRKSTSRPSTDI